MKKKLTLDLETIGIEQLEVQPAAARTRGTVQAFHLSDVCTEPCRFSCEITWSCNESGCC